MTARMRHLRHRELDGLARDRLDRTKDALALGIPPNRKPEYVFTANNAANTLEIAGVDTAATGNPRVILEGDLPAELKTGTIYWLAFVSAATYSLHSTKAAAAAGTGDIAFTDNGTGTLRLTVLD